MSSSPDRDFSVKDEVLVIACGMIAREVLAVKAQAGLHHLHLTCLPAAFHFHPDRIAPAIEKAVEKARDEGFTRIFVGYGDCGTGGELDRVCARLGVERVNGPHCFAFYQGIERFEALGEDDMTSFYMTDFLCRQFDAFFTRPLGLDRHPELARDYFGHYEKLVYLAQTDDPALDAVAEKAAQSLGLAYERRFTGYGDLASALKHAAEQRKAPA
ncbi:MAG: DUF1638 domain-containing protein [Methylobacterium mesophilicum]|nr:DUF1638 domain-containing protein [Methylobacterium mesophilicum]